MKGIRLAIVLAMIIAFLPAISVYAESGMVRVKVAGQFGGNLYSSETGNNLNVATGFALGAEALFGVLPWLQVGGGVEYQFLRGVSFQGVSGGNLQFVPIYGILRVPYKLGSIEPYAIARAGYAFYSGDSTFTDNGLISLSGGFYFTIGGGIAYRLGGFAIFAEANYALDDGSESVVGVNTNVSYTKVDVSAGVSVPF